MPRAKNRRGAMLVLASVLMVVMLGYLSFVVYLSRAYVQKNELQTAADAAALAGVIQLIEDSSTVDDSASAFSEKNPVFNKVIAVPGSDVECGIWTDAAGYTPAPPCGFDDNAVKVITRDSTVWDDALPYAPSAKEVQQTSIAFLAFVNGAGCIKPWGIPYPKLTKTLDPASDDTLRDLTAEDLQKLLTWTPEQLYFTVKYGDPTSAGNFGILQLPGSEGGNDYRNDIATCNPVQVAIGDTISVLTGDKKGPTIQGAEDLCQPLEDPSGACLNTGGGVGKIVLAPLYYTPTVCGGTQCDVIIKNLVSFSLDTVTSNADISGHFVAFASGGTIGDVPSTIRRPILVK
jgi:hypothetical protein